MITLYTKPACPYCVQAKQLLESKNIEYKLIHVNIGQSLKETDISILRSDFLEKFPNQRTLPLILEDDTIIGGFTELQKHLK